MKNLQLHFFVLAVAVMVVAESGSALAAGANKCPAFTASMIDAAFLVSDVNSLPGSVIVGAATDDDPSAGDIVCQLTRTQRFFRVETDALNTAASVEYTVPGTTSFIESRADGLTKAQLHSCRAEVINSFPWAQYCGPALGVE